MTTRSYHVTITSFSLVDQVDDGWIFGVPAVTTDLLKAGTEPFLDQRDYWNLLNLLKEKRRDFEHVQTWNVSQSDEEEAKKCEN